VVELVGEGRCCSLLIGVLIKLVIGAECRWLMPEILATQEAEIRGITVQSQPVQIVHEMLSQKNASQKKGLVE
jgi:hypothetical protein